MELLIQVVAALVVFLLTVSSLFWDSLAPLFWGLVPYLPALAVGAVVLRIVRSLSSKREP